MQIPLLFASVLAMAGAAPTQPLSNSGSLSPLRPRADNNPPTNSGWQAAPGTKSTCDHDTDKLIGFYVGPQMESVVQAACVAMMPECAYPDRLPAETNCPQIVTWQLDSAKNSTQSANVEALNGDKLAGWAVKFSVTPAVRENPVTADIFWTRDECYGYFAQLLQKLEPEGCHRQEGFGIGSLTVGGDSDLAGTIFKTEIVKEK